MTEVGYQDFGRSVQTNLLPVITWNSVVGGSIVTAAEYIGDLGYVDVFVQAAGLNNNYSIGLRWWDDPSLFAFAGQDIFIVGPGMDCRMQYKCGGRYVQLVLGNNVATDVNPLVVYVRGTNAQHLFLPGQRQSNPLILADQTINAGASVSFLSDDIAPGPAVVSIFHGSNNTWSAELDYWEFTANSWQRFVSFQGATLGMACAVPVILPAAPTRLTLTNADTVNRTMYAALCA